MLRPYFKGHEGLLIFIFYLQNLFLKNLFCHELLIPALIMSYDDICLVIPACPESFFRKTPDKRE